MRQHKGFALEKPGMRPRLNHPVRVLAVTENADTARRLNDLFVGTRWKLAIARSCEEAHQRLTSGNPCVVLCEAKLSDGCWRTILDETKSLENPPKIIVTSNQADEKLWTEVLTEGAYDLLPKPLDKTELFRIVSLACRDWWHRQGFSVHAHAGA
jgi:DNA-binding NtrC family response regulator